MGASVLQATVVRSAALCKMLHIEAYTQVEASKQWDVPACSIVCPSVLVVCDDLHQWWHHSIHGM